MNGLRQKLDFVRHVPPVQVLARMRLIAQRRVERTLRPGLGNFTIAPALAPPGPLFPPRHAAMTKTEAGWRFEALGHRDDLGAHVDWARSGPPGRDQLWRMTLHYMEYLEALDDGDFTELVSQWIAGNPPYRGGADHYSWNAYALSLRTVVWMQQLATRESRLDAGFLDTVRQALAEQLDYLERHLELDIGGNHLIKNIKALVWGSAFFQGDRATRWRRRGLRLLDEALDHQILADGMHFERSPSYHCQVTADLAEIQHALGDEGKIARRLSAALAKALSVADALAHPDGRVAQFSDAGLHMAYTGLCCRQAIADGQSQRPSIAGPFILADAGYFGLRTPHLYFVADAGPIAPDVLPAHGHGDIGSFEWSLEGARMIVDQGVFEYLAGHARHQSRRCANHNTLAIEGMDQAAFFGAFRSAFRARICKRECTITERGMILELAHDGFVRSGGPIHHRRFEVDARGFSIKDELEGALPAQASVTLLLHPDVAVSDDPQDRAGQIVLSHAKGSARVTASYPLTVEPGVWWPDIGVERKTNRLRMIFPPGQRAGRLTVAILDQIT